MEVSFILSKDELYTLISIMGERTVAGKRFVEQALTDAVLCDLSGLADKALGRTTKDGIELETVTRMIVDAIAKADRAELFGEIWKIDAPWLSLECECCQYREGHWKVTPIRGAEQ